MVAQVSKRLGLTVIGGLIAASVVPASAQRVAVVPVAVAGAPERSADLVQAASALGDRVTVVGDGVALARAARLAGAIPASRLAAMAQVVAGGAEAWRAYLQVAVPFAASRLSKARSDAEALLSVPGGLELYADLSLRLGAALLSLGRTEEAEEALALALAIDPEREVSLVEFSPDIVEAAERARRRQTESVPVVISTPGVAGARIELDGRAVGRGGTPPGLGGASALRLSLPRGQHVVVARRAGYEDVAQAVRIDAGTTEVELRMVADRIAMALETAAAPGLAAGVLAMDDELATSLLEGVLVYADVDEVLLVASSSRRGAPALLAQRCGASLRCTAVVEVGYARPGVAAALRQAWSALARGELRYAPSLPSDPRILPGRGGGGEDGKCRLCRNPWLWAGVGTALAVTSAVLVFTLGQDDASPVLTVDPDTFVQ